MEARNKRSCVSTGSLRPHRCCPLLDRLSCSCMAHGRAQQTHRHRQTDYATSVAITGAHTRTHTHTHTHPFNGPFSGINRVGRYQKSKTNLDFTEARDSEWQWHQLGHMQVCISLQTDNHASTTPLSFFTGRMPFLPPNQQRQSTEGTTGHRSTTGNKTRSQRYGNNRRWPLENNLYFNGRRFCIPKFSYYTLRQTTPHW